MTRLLPGIFLALAVSGASSGQTYTMSTFAGGTFRRMSRERPPALIAPPLARSIKRATSSSGITMSTSS